MQYQVGPIKYTSHNLRPLPAALPLSFLYYSRMHKELQH
jgi:hypothetical protein